MIHKAKTKKVIGAMLFYVAATALAAIVCIPFFWMISTSLKSRGALVSIPLEWLPKKPSFDSYQKLFAIPNFGRSIINSFYLAIICTISNLLC